MKTKLRRIGRLLGRTIDLVLGILGGLVWAIAGCMVAIQLYAIMHFSPVLLLVICLLLPVFLGLCGSLKPTYFSFFSAPLLSFFLGDGSQDDDKRLAVFFMHLALFAALLSIIVGMPFRLLPATGLGVVLFIAYAILAPRLMGDGSGP